MLTEIRKVIQQKVHNNTTHFTFHTYEKLSTLDHQYRTGYLGHHDSVKLPGKQKTTIHRGTTSWLWVTEEPGVKKLRTPKNERKSQEFRSHLYRTDSAARYSFITC